MSELFTRRDRIAIVCISVFILIGWGLRYYLYKSSEPDEITVIRNAVKLPPALNFTDKLSALPVNINLAGEKELVKLKGIGPAKAVLIIEYRKKHGHFEKTSDIMKVRGIGPATYESIREYITVEEKTPADKE